MPKRKTAPADLPPLHLVPWTPPGVPAQLPAEVTGRSPLLWRPDAEPDAPALATLALASERCHGSRPNIWLPTDQPDSPERYARIATISRVELVIHAPPGHDPATDPRIASVDVILNVGHGTSAWRILYDPRAAVRPGPILLLAPFHRYSAERLAAALRQANPDADPKALAAVAREALRAVPV